MTPSRPLTAEERQAPDFSVIVRWTGDQFEGSELVWWPDTRLFVAREPGSTSATGLDAMLENSITLHFLRGQTRVVDETKETHT